MAEAWLGNHRVKREEDEEDSIARDYLWMGNYKVEYASSSEEITGDRDIGDAWMGRHKVEEQVVYSGLAFAANFEGKPSPEIKSEHSFDGSSRLECRRCHRHFGTKNELLQHSRTHALRNKHCFGCYTKRSFDSYSAMLIHLESRNCKVCLTDLDFYAQRCYQSRKYVVHGYNNYLRQRRRAGVHATGGYDHTAGAWVCDVCQKHFPTAKGLDLHRASPVHAPTPLKCPSCDDRFAVLSGLVQHVENSGRCAEKLEPGSSLAKVLHFIHSRVSKRPRGLIREADREGMIY